MKKINYGSTLMSVALVLCTVFSVHAAAAPSERSAVSVDLTAALYLSYAQEIVELIDVGHAETLEYKEILSEHILVLHRAMGLDDASYHMNDDFLEKHHVQLQLIKCYVGAQCHPAQASFKAAERMIDFIVEQNRARIITEEVCTAPVKVPSFNEKWANKFLMLVKTGESNVDMYHALVGSYQRAHAMTHIGYKRHFYMRDLNMIINFLADQRDVAPSAAIDRACAALKLEIDLVAMARPVCGAGAMKYCGNE